MKHFRGGQLEKMLIPYTFNILAHFFSSFSWQIIQLKKVMCTLFEGEGGFEKVHHWFNIIDFF